MPQRTWQEMLAIWAGSAPEQAAPVPAQAELSSRLSDPLLEQLIQQAVFAADSAERLAQYKNALKAVRVKSPAPQAAAQLEQERQRVEALPVQASLGANAALLSTLFEHASDVVYRTVALTGDRVALIVYLRGMVDEQSLEHSVLDPLIRSEDHWESAVLGLTPQLVGNNVPSKRFQPMQTVGQVADAMLSGDTTILLSECEQAVRLATAEGPARAVTEPPTELSIRGAREGFVERLQTNVALLRMRIRSPHFRVESFTIGRRSRTDVCLTYLEGVAKPEIIHEVKARINRIDVDALQNAGALEELIHDQVSVFPQTFATERPDRVASALLEGQVALVVDGNPFVLVVPVVFWSFMTAVEDYIQSPWYGTIYLWLRLAFLLLSLAGPAFYVAIASFHQEMLPTDLVLSVASSREGVPFPAVVETLLLDTFFEALREASVRLPRAVGNAISIVGALVIGEAIVRAGLVSASVVIVVATAGIASFTVPAYSLGVTIRLLRFPLTLLAGMFGLLGVATGLIALMFHLCSLRSFGVPYLQPIAPLSTADLKDSVVRLPTWLMGNRPVTFGAIDRQRQAKKLKPGPRERRS